MSLVKEPKVIIRRATFIDKDKLSELWNEQYLFHLGLDPIYYSRYDNCAISLKVWSELLPNALTNPECYIFIALKEEKIIGFIRFSLQKIPYSEEFCPHYGEIEDIYVANSERKISIGNDLISSAMIKLKELGASYLKTQCSINNQNAINFFHHNNFISSQTLLFKEI